MAATVHIQGFGIVGSMLGALLAAEGIEFTWNDIDAKPEGWRAGTGCVLPTGYEVDHQNLTMWMQHLGVGGEPDAFGEWMQQFMDINRWCYISKAPPHQGKKAGVEALAEVGPVKVSNSVTVNLNSQAMVEQTRERFADQRTEKPKKKQTVIVSHGSATAIRYTWGWSGIVKINESDELKEALHGQRATYYLRKGVRIAYLYPVPHTNLYYAGTDIISQTNPKSLSIKPKYERWKGEVEERSGGLITVKALKKGSLKEGWRPIADSAEKFSWVGEDGTVYCRAMSGDGVRHFPQLGRSVLAAL